MRLLKSLQPKTLVFLNTHWEENSDIPACHFNSTFAKNSHHLNSAFWQVWPDIPCEVSQWILCAAWTKLPNCSCNLRPSRLLDVDAALLQERRLTLPWKPAGAPCPTANTRASLKMTHILHLAEDTAGEGTAFWPAARPTCAWPPAQVREIITWVSNWQNIGH